MVLEGSVEEASLDRLWAVTDGNLLFVRELVLDSLDGGRLRRQHGVWRWSGHVGAGARLAEVVAAHLGELTPSARHLLEVVALGEPLGLELLHAVVPGADLSEAERQGRGPSSRSRTDASRCAWATRSSARCSGRRCRSAPVGRSSAPSPSR